jgi:hypothetical protein
MNAKYSSLLRAAGLVAGALLLVGRTYAADTDAFPVFENNYIRFSATGGSFNDGAKAAAQRRLQLPTMGAGGIEAFSYGKDISKETAWQVDGKALGNAGDYLAQFKMTKNEVGSFEVGYKRYRTFYDGLGGFFPINNQFLPIYQRANYVDRGKFYVEGKVELPKAPAFTFRYRNETRTGTKDSTIWGETSQTGLYSGVAPGARKIVPAYLHLNERQQTIEGSVHQTFGKTTASATIVGTRINNDDTRAVNRYAGEAKPFPNLPTTGSVLIPPTLAQNQTAGPDQQKLDEKGWTIGGKVETALNDNTTVYAGASYHFSSGDVNGTRLIAATITTAAGRREYVGGFNNSNPAGTSWGRPPYSYTNSADIDLDVYTANLGVRSKIGRNLHVDVAVKAEDYTAIAKENTNYINQKVVLETGAVTQMLVSAASNTRNSEKVWTPEVSARYTGIRHVSLFGSWEYRSSPGDESGTAGSLSVATGPGTVSAGFSPYIEKVKEKHGNLKVGANWSPNTAFNVRTTFFTKDHQNRFEGYAASAGDYYILDYDLYGVKTSVQIRVTPTLSFTTRYITQRGKAGISEENSFGTFNTPGSGRSSRDQFSETVNWSPNKSFFVQADANFVYDQVKSSYQYVTGTARDVIRNSNNDYWNGSLVTGFVVDKYTNATLQGSYYKAGNYERALAATTMPYGAGGREYSIAAGVTRKFSDRWMGSAKIGYFESRNDTAGGFANFRGPLAYIAIEHGL